MIWGNPGGGARECCCCVFTVGVFQRGGHEGGTGGLLLLCYHVLDFGVFRGFVELEGVVGVASASWLLFVVLGLAR